MRKIGRQRRLRGPATIGLAAMVAIAVGGSLAASQAMAATRTPTAARGGNGGLSVSRQFFGQTVEPYTGKETNVYRYTLSNANGMSVQILTFGGIIQDINVPDKSGNVTDVVLGFKTLQDYVTEDSPPVTANGGPYFGETIGRYGNRIAKGTFTLNQPGVGPVKYTLPINNGVNSLHGGLVGFGDHIWADQPVQGHGSVGVQLTLVSPNGDASGAAGSPGCPNGCTGYPGTIKVVVPAAAMKKLGTWHWPGNIRELENFIERSVILTHGPALQVPIGELGSDGKATAVANTRETSERDEILRILKDTKGRVAGLQGAAARMGLKRTTLISRMKKLGIDPRKVS